MTTLNAIEATATANTGYLCGTCKTWTVPGYMHICQGTTIFTNGIQPSLDPTLCERCDQPRYQHIHMGNGMEVCNLPFQLFKPK